MTKIFFALAGIYHYNLNQLDRDEITSWPPASAPGRPAGEIPETEGGEWLMRMGRKSSRPRYMELVEFIREKIISGAWTPGHQLPTEHELTEMFGVSRTTTFRALLELQKAGLVVREQGRGTFVSPKHDSPGKTGGFSGLKVVAMILPDSTVDSGFKIIEGAEKWLRQHGYRLLSIVSEFNLEREAELIRGLFYDGVTNLILYPIDSVSTAVVVEEMMAKGMKVVIIDRRLNNLPMPFVGTDNYTAGYEITTHLIKIGHRAIAFVLRETRLLSSVADRFRGYCAALVDHGLPVDPALVINGAQLSWSPPAAANTAVPETTNRSVFDEESEKILGYLEHLGASRPSAVLVEYDAAALALLKAALRLGIRVPEELALAGFDDLHGSAMAEVPLTTMRQQFRLMGREAVKLICGATHDEAGRPREVLLPAELIVRRSCGVKETAEVSG